MTSLSSNPVFNRDDEHASSLSASAWLETSIATEPLSGWVHIELRLVGIPDSAYGKLFWDEGSGYRDRQVCLTPQFRQGRTQVLLFVHGKLQEIKVALDMRQADSGQLQATVQALPFWKSLFLAARPYLPQLLYSPRRYWQVARQLARIWKTGGKDTMRLVAGEMLVSGSEALTLQYISALADRVRQRQCTIANTVAGMGITIEDTEAPPEQLRIVVGLIEDFGDIVAGEPVVRYLRRLFPTAEISWAVRNAYRELVDSHPDIDQTIVVDCLTDWMKHKAHGQFDHVVDLHLNQRVCRACRVPLVKNEGDVSVTRKTHLRNRSLLTAFCNSAGLPALDETPRVHISSQDRQFVDALALPARFVVLHTQSNSYQKDWRLDHWQQLARHLMSQGIYVVEIGLTQHIDLENPHYRSVCGQTTFMQTAEVIRRASLFIGVESGPAHLSNAVGTFAAVIIGRFSRFKTYNPYSGDFACTKHVRFARNLRGTASKLAFEPVLVAVTAALSAKGLASTPTPISDENIKENTI